MENIKHFFIPKDKFEDEDWILKHQIFALLIISFGLGIGIFFFAVYRVTHGHVVAGVAQFIFAFFLLGGFFMLRKNKKIYRPYSVIFFLFFFIYIHIVFFFVPENHLNILWIVTAPVLIFFFLDKTGGVLIFILLLGFIVYLLVTHYPYTIAEYITLFATISTTTLVMYAYEKVKEAERERLLSYNKILKGEIEKQTAALKGLNETLQHKVEEEVERRLAQEQMLLRQSRMASMGEMIDSIAHQWRQPLMNINAVMMNLDLGIKQKHDEKMLEEKVFEVFSLTSHMSRTIEDFRNLLKEQKEKNRFLVSELIDEVLGLMKNNLKGIEIEKRMDESSTIETYKSELSQVLIILLSNAAEILHIREVSAKKIYLYAEEGYGELLIAVEDNAGGIDNIDKVFDPYFTTKEQTGGTGLGLYIAKIIIEHNMQGELSAHNTKAGARFELLLPV